jgi:hypothetical protein
MSCEACDLVQEAPIPSAGIYIRIGSGNVYVLGCNDHVRELIQRLRREIAGDRSDTVYGGD